MGWGMKVQRLLGQDDDWGLGNFNKRPKRRSQTKSYSAPPPPSPPTPVPVEEPRPRNVLKLQSRRLSEEPLGDLSLWLGPREAILTDDKGSIPLCHILLAEGGGVAVP